MICLVRIQWWRKQRASLHCETWHSDTLTLHFSVETKWALGIVFSSLQSHGQHLALVCEIKSTYNTFLRYRTQILSLGPQVRKQINKHLILARKNAIALGLALCICTAMERRLHCRPGDLTQQPCCHCQLCNLLTVNSPHRVLFSFVCSDLKRGYELHKS